MYIESYRDRYDRVKKEYSFCYEEMYVEREEKLRAELDVINNTPLIMTDRNKKVKRVNSLYAKDTYKSKKVYCIH